jgi:hypothetical protein
MPSSAAVRTMADPRCALLLRKCAPNFESASTSSRAASVAYGPSGNATSKGTSVSAKSQRMGAVLRCQQDTQHAFSCCSGQWQI